MFELTINGKVYGFNFGFGFLRDVNKQVHTKADNNGVSQNVGLNYKLASVYDHDPETLIEVLDIANRYAPGNDRITRDALEAYVESPECDIDRLCEDLLDFFEVNNTTKKGMRTLKTLVALPDEQKEKILQAAQQ